MAGNVSRCHFSIASGSRRYARCNGFCGVSPSLASNPPTAVRPSRMPNLLSISPATTDRVHKPKSRPYWRDAIFAQIAAGGKTLSEALNDRALQIHLQRIVGAHVASAYGAAQFYSAKLSI